MYPWNIYNFVFYYIFMTWTTNYNIITEPQQVY
jgi:hypothetical protein